MNQYRFFIVQTSTSEHPRKFYQTWKLLNAKQPTFLPQGPLNYRRTSNSEFQITRFPEGKFTFHFLLGCTFSDRFWKYNVALPPSMLSLLLPI